MSLQKRTEKQDLAKSYVTLSKLENNIIYYIRSIKGSIFFFKRHNNNKIRPRHIAYLKPIGHARALHNKKKYQTCRFSVE